MTDYNIYELSFPNRSTPAMVFVNDDGSFDIYLNLLYSQEAREAALEHELRHIREEHFYSDVPLGTAERQAEGESLNIVLNSPAGKLSHFPSEAAFAHWLKCLGQQLGLDVKTIS